MPEEPLLMGPVSLAVPPIQSPPINRDSHFPLSVTLNIILEKVLAVRKSPIMLAVMGRSEPSKQ